jgi:hypothetical protein
MDLRETIQLAKSISPRPMMCPATRDGQIFGRAMQSTMMSARRFGERGHLLSEANVGTHLCECATIPIEPPL